MSSILRYLFSLWRKNPVVRTDKHSLPLPEVCHLELSSDVIKDRRVFVVGDVHGCFDELHELVERVKEIDKNTLFVFVGDLINKGPKNKDVLEFVQSLDCYSVRGNHDEAALNQYFLSNQPDYNLPDRYKYIKDIPPKYFKYLANLPFTISIPSMNALVVHAGLVPGQHLEAQDLVFMTHMRNIEERFSIFHRLSSTLVPLELTTSGVPWASVWTGPEHVFFGHDALRGFQSYPYATGLDTGCVYGHKLTGMFIDNKDVISVESHQPKMFSD